MNGKNSLYLEMFEIWRHKQWLDPLGSFILLYRSRCLPALVHPLPMPLRPHAGHPISRKKKPVEAFFKLDVPIVCSMLIFHNCLPPFWSVFPQFFPKCLEVFSPNHLAPWNFAGVQRLINGPTVVQQQQIDAAQLSTAEPIGGAAHAQPHLTWGVGSKNAQLFGWKTSIHRLENLRQQVLYDAFKFDIFLQHQCFFPGKKKRGKQLTKKRKLVNRPQWKSRLPHKKKKSTLDLSEVDQLIGKGPGERIHVAGLKSTPTPWRNSELPGLVFSLPPRVEKK